MKPHFYTADHHFGHGAMIKYNDRPFETTDEMDDAMIAAWNAKVPANALVFHLGDFSFHKRERTQEIRKQLKGRIHMIKGNHDPNSAWWKDMFEFVKDRHTCRLPNETMAVLDHYPLLTWEKAHYGTWHLHGHSHGNLRPPPPLDRQRRMDVGVDTSPGFAPYSLAEVEAFMATRGDVSIDHHTPKT